MRTPNTKRLRTGDYPQLEQCVYLWLIDKVKNGISINDALIIKQKKIFGPSLAISDLSFKNTIALEWRSKCIEKDLPN